FGKGGQPAVHSEHTGHTGHAGHSEHTEAAAAMLVPIIITAAVSLVLGVMPDAGPHLYDLAVIAAEAITGGGGAIV
ncbi:MAG: hypothetical protein ACI4LL_01420, partial [Anaerovoracaceae bacterium]